MNRTKIARQFAANLNHWPDGFPVERQTIVDMAHQFADALAYKTKAGRMAFLAACGVPENEAKGGPFD
jgi:hypothetical protein